VACGAVACGAVACGAVYVAAVPDSTHGVRLGGMVRYLSWLVGQRRLLRSVRFATLA
jgi:hypothetical protein